jgi:high-affinity Fe2+/Pb2+ permease
MELLIVAGLLLMGAWWFYKAGKREGSQKGYRAGRNRRPRHRRRRG